MHSGRRRSRRAIVKNYVMVKPRDNPASASPAEKAERLSSLDAARGTFLLLLAGAGFGLKEILPGERWTWITSQWTHRE